MNRMFIVGGIAGASLFLLSGTAAAQSGEGDDVVFLPPEEGAPGDRVGAGTRGVDSRQSGVLTLLVPPGGGQTSQGSPLLAWHLSDGFEGRMRLTLKEKGAEQAWLVLDETANWSAGMHGLSLADLGITIEPGTILEWTLALEEASAKAQSFVERVPEGSKPETGGDPRAAMRALAADGLWFDALAQGVELTPADEVRATAQDGVASLLKSAGLPSMMH